MEGAFNTPLRGQRPPLTMGSSPSPLPAFGSPLLQQQQQQPSLLHTPVSDRFIGSRASQDSTLSHYLLTAKENMTPMGRLYGFSPSREGSLASSSAASPPRAGEPPSELSSSRATSTSRAGSPAGVGSVFAKLRLDGSAHHTHAAAPPPASPAGDAEPYSSKLARALFKDSPQTSVLGLHSASAAEQQQQQQQQEESRYASSLGVVFECNRMRNFRSKNFRVIPQTPERILDAADMIDDFYLNLVDWSSTDMLCVALQNAVYLWEAATSTITQLPTTRPADAPASIVCGVNWAPDGRHLAIGMNDGAVDVWDVEAQTIVRSWREHHGRVGSLSWTCGGGMLASGGKDTHIRLHDLRDRPVAGVLRGHQQEVCGLRWSPNGQALASGGNDNQLLIWDRRLLSNVSSASRPLLYLNQHTAAVKAIAWNPVQTSLLASGGGTDDKTLRFWNTATGDCVHHVDTQSQVCGVLWSRAGTELVSSHGFSLNQLTIWKYPSLRRVADLTGHTSRVLHLCLSADGEVVVSAAGDETIRFWRCFPPAPREASPFSPLAATTGSASAYRHGASSPDPSYAHYYGGSGTPASGKKARAASNPALHCDPMQEEYMLR